MQLVVAILGDGKSFTRQSQGKNVREDSGRGNVIASESGYAMRKNEKHWVGGRW